MAVCLKHKMKRLAITGKLLSMWESLFKLVLEVIDAERSWNQIYINRNVKFMPFLYHGSHLGFQGIRMRKNDTLFFPYIYIIF